MSFLRRRRRARSGDDAASAEGERAPDTSADAGEASDGAPAGGTAEPSEPSESRGLLSDTREALKPVKKRHVVIASLGLMGIGFAGVLLFSGFSLWWTSQPSFCDRCHVMNKYVDTWDRSAHTGINCEHCHINPGLFSFIGGKISGLQVVANYITGHYEDYSFNAAVTNGACLECHEDILDGTIENEESGIRVSHREIIEGGGKCMNCHSTVAHGDAVPIGSRTSPTMQTCLVCHDDETAPLSDCGVCHLTPQIGKQP
jgi:nitrate/TMAO reductase-like tetraheme cytochrome c subunit